MQLIFCLQEKIVERSPDFQFLHFHQLINRLAWKIQVDRSTVCVKRHKLNWKSWSFDAPPPKFPRNANKTEEALWPHHRKLSHRRSLSKWTWIKTTLSRDRVFANFKIDSARLSNEISQKFQSILVNCHPNLLLRFEILKIGRFFTEKIKFESFL